MDKEAEFKKLSPNKIESKRGFIVTLLFRAGVEYEEQGLRCFVDSELMGPVDGLFLYRTSRSNRGFDGLDEKRRAEIFENISRAVQFLGMKVEMA